MSTPQHASADVRPVGGRRRRKLVMLGAAVGILGSLALVGFAWSASQSDHGDTATPAGTPGTEDTVVRAAGVSEHIACEGDGGPTVVIVNGLGADPSVWDDEVPALAKTSRVCLVDRAGTGDSPDRQKDANGPVENADELLAGLSGAGESGPYVLVGWSYGGVVSLVAADEAEQSAGDKLAGLVLVDPSLPEEYRTLDKQGWVEGGKQLDMQAGEAAVSGLRLGDTPTVVLEAGEPLPRAADEKYQHDRMMALARLSKNSVFGTVPDSPHDIAGYSPKSVVAAVTAVVESSRNGNAPLGRCPEGFAVNAIVCG